MHKDIVVVNKGAKASMVIYGLVGTSECTFKTYLETKWQERLSSLAPTFASLDLVGEITPEHQY